MVTTGTIDYIVEHVASRVEAKLRAKVATTLSRGPVSEQALHQLTQRLVDDAFELVRTGCLAAPNVDLEAAGTLLTTAHAHASRVMQFRASAVLGSAIDDRRVRTP